MNKRIIYQLGQTIRRSYSYTIRGSQQQLQDSGGFMIMTADRLHLANLPTPLMQVHSELFNFDLWIKRDDMAGVELSGNKARKLEYLLFDAKQKECDSIVTIGGVQSNQCRAAAAACARLKMDCYVILRIEPQAKLSEQQIKAMPLQGNLLLDYLFGAKILFVTAEEYRLKGSTALVKELADKLRQEGKRPYEIPLGGSNSIGSWGYVTAVEELLIQMSQLHIRRFDRIFLAAGSGGTLAGITTGLWRAGIRDTKVIALTACTDPDYFMRLLRTELLPKMGVDNVEEALRPVEIHQARGMGYAVASQEDVVFIKKLAQQTGILLDPVYTGKAFRAAMNLCNSQVSQDSKILFWHTGGIFGLFAYAGMFSLDKPDVIPIGISDRFKPRPY